MASSAAGSRKRCRGSRQLSSPESRLRDPRRIFGAQCDPLPPRLRRGGPSRYALLAHESTDALAPLLVASPGSGPPGSPNLSPRPRIRVSKVLDAVKLTKQASAILGRTSIGMLALRSG